MKSVELMNKNFSFRNFCRALSLYNDFMTMRPTKAPLHITEYIPRKAK